MASRTKQPEETRIELPTDGDWILVKKNLTWGEARDAEVRLLRSSSNGGGRLEMDPAQVGATLVVAYLLDWSLLDADGATIPVRRQSAETVLAALRALDRDKGNEIIDAIVKHEATEAQALAALKKTRNGDATS